MKSTTTAIAAYESPRCRVIEIDAQDILCASNESYEEGDTSNWFNN